MLHIDIGLTLVDHRRLSKATCSKIFMSIPPIVKEDPYKISKKYKQDIYSFLTCDDMTIKMWTQEPGELYLDVKIHIGTDPISVAVMPSGKVYVLTNA